MSFPSRKSVAGPQKAVKHSDSDELMTILQTAINCRRMTASVNVQQRPEDEEQCITAKKQFTTTEGRIKIVHQIYNSSEIMCCKYNASLNCVAGGYTDGTVKLYSSMDGELLSTFTDNEKAQSPVTDVQYQPLRSDRPATNSFLCSYTSGNIKCWDYVHNQCIFNIKTDFQVLGLTYHPTLPKFLAYGDNGKIYLYNEETRTCESVFQRSCERQKHDGHTSRVFACCYHPISPFEFISAGWDNVVQFWDVRRPNAVRHIFGVHVAGKGIDINSTGTQHGQKENPLQLYDYKLGKLISNIVPDVHNCKLYCGCFVNNDVILTGGTDPNLFRIVDLRTDSTIAKVNYLPGAVYSIDIGGHVKQKLDQSSSRTMDISNLPKIAFASKKKLYEIQCT